MASIVCAIAVTASATAQTPPQNDPTKDPLKDPARQTDPTKREVPQGEVVGRVIRVSKLLDCNVKNTRGEKIGEVEDLIIDKDEGMVGYAICSFGGFLGIGEKLFAVPFSNVQRTSDESNVVLDVSKEQLEKAPNFGADAWPEFDRKYGTTVHDYYKSTPYWQSHQSKADPTRIDRDALDKDRMRASGNARATKAIGTNIEDPAGKNLGEIDDIVVDDGTGRVIYAVLSFGGFLGMGDKLFALPWQSLKASTKDEKKMVLDVPKERLQAAPGFDKKNWPNMADRRWGTEVHKYYGQPPYWENDRRTNANEPPRKDNKNPNEPDHE
jgi:sporulation protein YlmC with PRC-barrel domain